LQFEKTYFLYFSFLAAPSALHSKDDFEELEEVLVKHFKSLKMEKN
jgi:hypothetical protein